MPNFFPPGLNFFAKKVFLCFSVYMEQDIFAGKNIKRALLELGLNRNETAAYMALTQLGESPVSAVAKKAGLTRTTTASVLERLCADGYMSSHRYRGKTWYWIESPKMIGRALENRMKIAKELEGLLADFYRSEADFPSAKIYDTKSGIKTFIEKTLNALEKDAVILTIDTPGAGNYTRIFSDGFGEVLLDIKRKKRITTRTLIPWGFLKDIDPKKKSAQDIVLRELPQEIRFSASFWIVGDTLVLFSGRYPFIVAVRHRIIVSSMRSILEYLWKISGAQAQILE